MRFLKGIFQQYFSNIDRMRISCREKATLLFFRSSSNLGTIAIVQSNPITSPQQQHHRHWQRLEASYLCSTECYLTNETQIISKTTNNKVSPNSWTAVLTDGASNCPTVTLKCIQNELWFNSLHCPITMFYVKPIRPSRVLTRTFAFFVCVYSFSIRCVKDFTVAKAIWLFVPSPLSSCLFVLKDL